jgi:hypothetical protein
MAKDALSVHPTAEPAPGSALRDYAYVRLRHAIQAGDTTYAPGTRKVIVHRHADGVGDEVEFEQPVFRVLTLNGRDIRAASLGW